MRRVDVDQTRRTIRRTDLRHLASWIAREHDVVVLPGHGEFVVSGQEAR